MEYYNPVNYTTEYYTSTNNLFDSNTIPASECEDGDCKQSLNVSLLSCQNSSHIKALVYGTNILGNGNISDPVFVGMIVFFCSISRTFFTMRLDMKSTKVFVRFNSNHIYCTLQNGSGFSSCNITYEAGDNCISSQYDIQSVAGVESSMDSIQLSAVPHEVTICFIAIASNATSTVILKGTYRGTNVFIINIDH